MAISMSVAFIRPTVENQLEMDPRCVEDLNDTRDVNSLLIWIFIPVPPHETLDESHQLAVGVRSRIHA